MSSRQAPAEPRRSSQRAVSQRGRELLPPETTRTRRAVSGSAAAIQCAHQLDPRRDRSSPPCGIVHRTGLAGHSRSRSSPHLRPSRRWFGYRWPTGITQRNALSSGLWHQHEDEHSHRRMPTASAARVPRAAHKYRVAAPMTPRLMATLYVAASVVRSFALRPRGRREDVADVRITAVGWIQPLAAVEELLEFCLQDGEFTHAPTYVGELGVDQLRYMRARDVAVVAEIDDAADFDEGTATGTQSRP